VSQAYEEFGWYAGVMYWQVPSDGTGSAINTAAAGLIAGCAINLNCV